MNNNQYSTETKPHLTYRLMASGIGFLCLVLLACSQTRADEGSGKAPSVKRGDTMKVAAVQFRSTQDLESNIERHAEYMRLCARNGARVVVFPECSVTGYDKDAVTESHRARLKEVETRLSAVAKEANVYALVGMPTLGEGKLFNSVVVFDPSGKILERYHKIHLAGEKWATPGDHMSVFPVDGLLCSIIICHDERYPELVRFPVMAGARVVFYISHESGIENEHKMGPYRAQIQARAVENSVYVVHANAPAEKDRRGGSHGQSRVAQPDGNLAGEASIFEEEVLYATLDLDKATGMLAQRSMEFEALRNILEQGVAQVKHVVK